MLNFRYIIFDVDGTLINSGPYLNKILEATLKKSGHDELARPELVQRFVGVTLYEGFTQLCNMTEEESDYHVELFDQTYKEIAPDRTVAISGVEELLKTLIDHGKTLAVATNGSTENATLVLSACGLAKYFSFIGGLSSLGANETKADVINKVIDKLDIKDRKDIVMVGDRDIDIEAAISCGLTSIGILHGGCGSVEELQKAGANYIVNDAEELINLILN